MEKQDRYEQKERWIAEGLEAIGSGLAYLGFWIGLGNCFESVVKWLDGKL